MIKTFRGGSRGLEVYRNRSHHHQEEDEMARADMLAFLLYGWKKNGLNDDQDSPNLIILVNTSGSSLLTV